jgi:hypothetical protein
MRWALFTLLAGCVTPAVSLDAPIHPIDGSAPSIDTIDASACDTLALVATRWEGHPVALFVPVIHEASPAFMHLDSAAGFSILYLPEGTPWTAGAGEARIGCEVRSLDGWGVVDPGFDPALSVVGTLGGDWLFEAPTLLEADRLARSAPPPPWATTPLSARLVNDTLVVTMRVEGRERLLLLDTGAAYVVLDGEGARPGDVAAPFFDWNGDEVEAYLGSAELELGSEVTSVPVLRTPAFIGVSSAAASTGLPITGLLGLSAFQALYVDPAASALFLLPR